MTEIQDLQPIAAVGSPPGLAERALIRISGKELIRVLPDFIKNVLTPLSSWQYTNVDWPLPSLDSSCPVTLFWMPGPKSFTREDVLEIHLPGAPTLTAQLLADLGSQGIRPAKPGEFTQRAYKNKRINARQVQAVMTAIYTANEQERRAAVRTLGRPQDTVFGKLRTGLDHLIAELEAALDFVEAEDVGLKPHEAAARIGSLLDIISSRPQPKRQATRHAGFTIAVMGKSNAGKSTLINAFTQKERVLVSPEPFTTRDIVEIPYEDWVFMDAPGDFTSRSDLEAQSLARRQEALDTADLHLWVIDGRTCTDEAFYHAQQDPFAHVIALTHCDCAEFNPRPGAVSVSGTTGEGLAQLKRKLQARLNASPPPLSEAENKFYAALDLTETTNALETAKQRAELGEGHELTVLDLKIAQDHLERLVGKSTNEDILGLIFSSFCIGK